MLDVNITYHAQTRLMEITSITAHSQYDNVEIDYGDTSLPNYPVATTGDDMMTTLVFTFDDIRRDLDGYIARVEFGVYVREEAHAYKPFIILGEIGDDDDPPLSPLENRYTAVLPQSILSSVKCSVLPIQLAFVQETGRENEKTEFYSLNTLNLAIEKALDAVSGASYEREPNYGDLVYNVLYNKDTSTFSFLQTDGTQIEIALSDLSEEHYEVESYYDLTSLDMAESGDTATAMDSGVWYKLYGDYRILHNWYPMPGGATINGVPTGNPTFYAPIVSGTDKQVLTSAGEGNEPEWRTMSRSFYINFSSKDTYTIPLYGRGAEGYVHWIDVKGANIHCEFYDRDTGENIVLPYMVVEDGPSTIEEPLYSVIVTNKIHNRIRMNVYAIPSLGGIY